MAAQTRPRRLRHTPRHARRRNHRARRFGGRWPVAILAVLAVVGALISAQVRASVATAAAQPQLKTGAGKWVAGHTAFVGYYRALIGGKWVKVYCVSPDKRTPSRISLATVSRLHSVSATVTRELAQTLSAHGNAKTAGQAEAVSQALNYEIGNRAAVAHRARYLSPSVQSLAMRYVTEARRSRGGYRLGLHLASSPLPGQTGRASVSLRGAGGGRAATVRLSHSGNVSLPRAVRTDAAGRASFSYRTTAGGAVHVGATVQGLPPITVRTSRPSASTQRMLSWSPTASVRASATYRGRVAGFSERYECTSTCDGNPLATLTACAPANGYPSSITYRHGATAHRVDFAAARSRTCHTWRTTLHDGEVVTASWRFRTPHGWTAPIPAGGSFRVDCPPAPPVAVAIGYDCRSATLTIALGRQSGGRLLGLHNATAHRMVLVLEGARVGRFTVAPGATATTHSFPIVCGEGATVAVRAGVQRTNGTYNYGGTTRVTLP